ncbi:MAG: response regulator, partial [Melioribacteraceae bacterium]|nr:response regulator [Melioribacteraceae bacterium]
LIDQIESDVEKVSVNFGKEFSYGKISSSLEFETDQSKLQVLISLLVEFAMRATENDKVYLSAYQTDPEHCVISVKDERDSISIELFDNLQLIFTGDESMIRHKFGISRFMLRYALKISYLISGGIGVINKNDQPSEYGFTFPIKFNDSKIEATKVIEESSIKEEEKPPTPSVEVQDAPTVEPLNGNGKDTTTEEQLDHNVEEKPTEPFSVQVNVNTQSNSQQNVQPVTADSEPSVLVEKPRAEVEKEVKTPEVAVAQKKINFENLSCLYVEDQIDSQILFKVQMKGLKTVQFANSFEKAIPLLQSRVFDFIIMDINLQGEYNGLDALRAIQKMESHKNVPVVAVTAYVLPGDRDRFITAGFTDFISKPILRDKLESVLNNIF